MSGFYAGKSDLPIVIDLKVGLKQEKLEQPRPERACHEHRAEHCGRAMFLLAEQELELGFHKGSSQECVC